MFPEAFQNLRLMAFDPYDLARTKVPSRLSMRTFTATLPNNMSDDGPTNRRIETQRDASKGVGDGNETSDGFHGKKAVA